MKKFVCVFMLGIYSVMFERAIAMPQNSSILRPQSRLAETETRLRRDQALVLSKKNEISGKGKFIGSSMDERTIYSELISAFERNDELGFASRFQRIMLDHSRGAIADDAVYLAGMMSLSNKQYAKAIKYFSKVLSEYPKSNRARAAMFAKAAAYRKMNLTPQAKFVFTEVKNRYPGSPEAIRSDVELRIIR